MMVGGAPGAEFNLQNALQGGLGNKPINPDMTVMQIGDRIKVGQSFGEPGMTMEQVCVCVCVCLSLSLSLSLALSLALSLTLTPLPPLTIGTWHRDAEGGPAGERGPVRSRDA